MTDLLNELQADIQEETLFSLWQQYGKYVIGLMGAILVATGAYLFWQHQRESTLAQQSMQYQTAVELIQEKRFEEALPILEALEKTQDGYKTLAQLQKTALKTQQALALASSQQTEALKAAFAPFMESGNAFPPLKNLTTIEFGYALLAAQQTDPFVLKSLEGYLTPQNPWKGLTLELTVLNAFQEKREGTIKKVLAKFLLNKDIPQGIQARIALETMGMGLSFEE